MLEHQTPTDQIKKVELPSSIQQVLWTRPNAAVGAKVGLEVFTQFVGNNSEIKIEISDKSGKIFETIKAKISGNHFWKQIEVPEKAKDELYAEVKLPKHALSKKSNCLYVYPAVQIKNLKWDKKEARRGDILKLTADVLNVYEGTEAEIQIWEHDSDGAHDLITKFPAIVKNKKIEAEWEYEYYEDTDDIPTAEETEKGYNPPEYFFRVIMAGVSADSGLLEFKDWIEIYFKDVNGNPIKDEEYTINLPDGTEEKGKLNSEGFSRTEKISPGKVKIEFTKFMDPELKEINKWLKTNSGLTVEDKNINEEKEIILEPYDLTMGLQGKTGEILKITLMPSIGRIAAILLDENGMVPLSHLAYELWLDNEFIISGKTDDKGYLYHYSLLDDYYTLKVCNEEYGIGTIGHDDAPTLVCIIGQDYPWINDGIDLDDVG